MELTQETYVPCKRVHDQPVFWIGHPEPDFNKAVALAEEYDCQLCRFVIDAETGKIMRVEVVK